MIGRRLQPWRLDSTENASGETGVVQQAERAVLVQTAANKRRFGEIIVASSWIKGDAIQTCVGHLERQELDACSHARVKSREKVIGVSIIRVGRADREKLHRGDDQGGSSCLLRLLRADPDSSASRRLG